MSRESTVGFTCRILTQEGNDCRLISTGNVLSRADLFFFYDRVLFVVFMQIPSTSVIKLFPLLFSGFLRLVLNSRCRCRALEANQTMHALFHDTQGQRTWCLGFS